MTPRPSRGFPFVLLAWAVTAQAGPAAPDAQIPLSAPQAPVQSAPALMTDPAQDGGKSTIDLLIEMQPREPGLQFGDRPRPSGSMNARAPTPARPATPAATPAPPAARVDAHVEAPSGLFGVAATPSVQTRTAASPATPTGAPRLPSEQSPAPTAALREPLPAWLDWPRQALLYVRDNRGLVLGGAAAGLLLIWGVSALLARIGGRSQAGPGPGVQGVSGQRWYPEPSSQGPRSRHRSRRRHR